MSAALARRRARTFSTKADPRQRTARHHPLRGDLAIRVLQGRTMERWQHEITAGGRVWLLIDEDKHTVWIDEVHLGHPAKTDTWQSA